MRRKCIKSVKRNIGEGIQHCGTQDYYIEIKEGEREEDSFEGGY